MSTILISVYPSVLCTLSLQSMFTQGTVMTLQSLASGTVLCVDNGEVSGKEIKDGCCKATVLSQHIRESVDSLRRDGADTPIVRVHWKAFLTREYSRFKLFSARKWPIQLLLYPTIPHK